MRAHWIAVGLALSLGTGLSAESAPAPEAAPTFTLSQAQVTPDAKFVLPDYRWKWPHISLEEAQRLQKKKSVVFCDGRSLREWEDGHIPGAVSLPLGDFDNAYAKVKSRLKKASILVSYCHGEGCRLSDALAQRLSDKGFKDVAVFWGGYPDWTAAHMPLMDKDEKPLPTPAPTATPLPPSPNPTLVPAPSHP